MSIIARQKPVAEQVADVLRQRILDHVYVKDDRLPSEEKLAEEFRVSRSSVRSALAGLAAEGLVTRRQGDGTYVNRSVISSPTQSAVIWDFLDMIQASGRRASVQVLCQEYRPATRHEADALQLRANTEVLVFERLFLADDTPVFYSINVLPKGLIRKDFPPEAARTTIFTFLREYCQQEFASALADISATSGDARVCEVFGIDRCQPVLRFDEIFMNRSGLPLVSACNHYNDQVMRLRMSGPP